LLKEGLLEGKNAKHPNPRKRRTRAQPPQIRIIQPPPQGDDSLAMQSCSILELDQTRCHWPLGEVNVIATEFCGGATVPSRRYCLHHLRMARNSFL
jgi:GcrA cell cycle regulator